jgi:glycosyltransferase involved in cell wall biosynthesis
MKKEICFVSFASLPLLTSNEDLKYIGGAELTSILIGEELAKRDFKIKFITYDEKIGKNMIDGITIIKSYSPQLKASRLKKGLMIWNSLKEADADIYFQASGSAGIIPLFCIVHRKKYIKWIASNSDLMLDRIAHSFISKLTLLFDIKFAHKIIVQNKFQQDITEKKFKKKCILIKNPILIPKDNGFKEKKDKKIVLWVGTVRSVKQPEIYLEIAKRFPAFKFIMIGGEYLKDKKVFEEIQKESKMIPNLEFLGFIPHHMIQKYYEEAGIFLNTSRMEGFPNTFLEAWINRIPVISLNIDPDELICTEKLGFHSKSFEQMIRDVNTLLLNDSLRNEMGLNAKRYVEQNHDVKNIADQFETLINSF